VLPICTGEATKLVPYFSEKRRYDGEFLLGTETDTQDITGNIICRKDATHIPTSRIEEIFKALTGVQHQLTPQFSATKYKGKPSYYWARKGMVVPRKERCVHIETLHLVGRERQRVFFDLLCSSGTYVRSIVSDVGRLLGCGACLTGLRRLQCGSFPLEYALPLDRLESAIEDESEAPWFWPMIKLLPDFESIRVDETMVRKLRTGIAIPYNQLSFQNQIRIESGRKFKVIYNNTIVALGEFRTLREQMMLQPIRILHTIG
jgi:tRNA pseudouridine55 synthase